MADPIVQQACLLQAALPVGGRTFWHGLVTIVDSVERVFSIDDSVVFVNPLPAPFGALAIDQFWDDPQVGPSVPTGLPGEPPIPLNVVPGSVPLGGYTEGDAADVDELRAELGMAPDDDDLDDKGPHEVAKAAMRAWIGSLGLSVPFIGLNAETPRAGTRPGLPRLSIFFPSTEWTSHTPRQMTEPAPIGPYATGKLASVPVAEGGFGIPDDEKGPLAYDSDGRPILRVGEFTSRFTLRFEFARRVEARAVRREFPLALAIIAHNTNDPGLQGTQAPGVVHLLVAFEEVRVEGEEVSLYFDGADTFSEAVDVATRDRWILQYTGLAEYPWLESGVSLDNNELGIHILFGGQHIDLDDIDLTIGEPLPPVDVQP